MHIPDDCYPIKDNTPMKTADQVERIMRATHCSEETAALIVLTHHVKKLEDALHHEH